MANPPLDWQFHLGSVYFNTAGEPDDLGCLWTCTEPDGWAAPVFRGTSTEIPFDDGSDVPDAFMGARVIHLQGTLEAPSSAILERAKSRLMRESRLMNVDGQFYGRPEVGADRYCKVRRGGAPAFPNREAPRVTGVDLSLIAGDPYKYGATPEVVTVTSGSVPGGVTFPLTFPVTFTSLPAVSSVIPTSHNEGDLAAPMLLAFNGPLGNPLLIGSDGTNELRAKLTASIPPGRSVLYDTRAQTVELDGDSAWDWFDDLASSDPAAMRVPPADVFEQPGTVQWRLYAEGAGNVTVTVRPTWE